MAALDVPSPPHDPLLAPWRDEVARGLLRLVALLTLPLNLWFAWSAVVDEQPWLMAIPLATQGALTALAVPPSLPQRVRSAGLLLVIVAVHTFELQRGGLSTHWIALALIGLFMASVFFDRFGALVVAGIVLAEVLVVTALATWAGLEVRDIPTTLDDPVRMTADLLLVGVIATILGTTTASLLGRLRQALAEQGASVDRLQAEFAEKEAALEALVEARDQLSEVQKTELVGQLAGGLAHDLNNLLTVILLEVDDPDEDPQESRETIAEAARRGAAIVQHLLGFSRRAVVQPRELDLARTVEGSLQTLARLLPDDIHLDFDRGSTPAMVLLDPAQADQILLNLVINARDAMPRGGRITVGVQDRGDRVLLQVSDNGVGIPEHVRDEVFEPLFTTKGPGEGTGLGLSVVRRIAEESGGHVSFETALGAGTTFTVQLPAISHAPPTPVTPIRRAAPVGPARRVLVVEDDPQVRRALQAALSRMGHEVSTADDGAEALEVLQSGLPLDLVVTDVVMPRVDGATVVAWLQEHRPDLPVLVCSGYAPDEGLRRGIRQGSTRYLAKPFSVADLVAAVDEALPPRVGR